MMMHMSMNATAAVKAFVDHVAAQETAKAESSSPAEFEPSADFKEERQALAENLLAAFGLTGAELQAKLAIGRATWDRWRHAATIPQRSHLETLIRFAEEKDADVSQSPLVLPPPLRMLASSPFSWARIKLVYTVYPWQDAVFKFRTPFIHEDTVLDMLLLAFRECRIVYIMPNANDWCTKFVTIAINSVGKSDTARALRRICIVSVSAEQADKGFQYGFFNYRAEKEDETAGYVWLEESDPNAEPPALSKRDVYRPVGPREDDVYGELREVYSTSLDKAFAEIDKRSSFNIWSSHGVGEYMLKIPVIEFSNPDQVIFCG